MSEDRKIDEAFLAEMMKRGEKAWKDVPDVNAWVEELRNGTLDMTQNKMRTYRKITIIFADEEPAMSYTDEALAQSMLERCEEWQQKELEICGDWRWSGDHGCEYRDKLQAHEDAHPLDPSYSNAQDYALKTVFLCE
jgi:hypothetical protein